MIQRFNNTFLIPIVVHRAYPGSANRETLFPFSSYNLYSLEGEKSVGTDNELYYFRGRVDYTALEWINITWRNAQVCT